MNYLFRFLDLSNLDIIKWIKAVKTAASLKSNTEQIIMRNKTPQHASIVMEYIFKESTNYSQGVIIKLYANNLDGTISSYQNYLNALYQFITTNTHNRLYVLIDKIPGNYETKPLSAFKLICQFLASPAHRNQVFLKIVKVEHKEAVVKYMKSTLSKNYHPHFAVSSLNYYRLEEDNDQHTAEYSFNNKTTCQQLNNIFDEIYKRNEWCEDFHLSLFQQERVTLNISSNV